MKHIESAQNPGFKALQRLVAEARLRRSSGLCWLEGERLVASALASIHAAHAAPPRLLALDGLPEVPSLLVVRESSLEKGLSLLRAAVSDPDSGSSQLVIPPAVWVYADRLFAQVSQVESDQGIGLVMPCPQAELPMNRSLSGDWVLLDRLQDPGNLGTLLRTAAAAGIEGVALMAGTTEAFSPKALRAGMGAQFALQVVEGVSLSALQDWLAALGRRLVLVQTVAPSETGAESLFASPTPLPADRSLLWAFGQEGSGLAEPIRRLDGLRISIPQSPEVESLNVSAAAAVCLFERLRLQRMTGNN